MELGNQVSWKSYGGRARGLVGAEGTNLREEAFL